MISEITEILHYAEAGKQLKDNAAYDLLKAELEDELAKTWRALAETPTTDPVIAKLQGEKQRLEWVLGRADSWVQRRLDYINSIKQETVTSGEDYNTG